MRIAYVGDGRMSRAVQQLAADRGHQVHAVIGSAGNRDGGALTEDRLRGADVAIEFTSPQAAPGNLIRLAACRVPTVSGTTGWQERLPEVAAAVTAHRAALLHGPNFSPGVQVFLRAARAVAREFRGQAGFDAFVVETHHGAKRDAPSGTALRLQQTLRDGDAERAFPVTSVRGGHAPGTHEVIYDAVYETVRLEHTARSRLVFAAGALQAAAWLQGREGVFTFDQMLFGEEP